LRLVGGQQSAQKSNGQLVHGIKIVIPSLKDRITGMDGQSGCRSSLVHPTGTLCAWLERFPMPVPLLLYNAFPGEARLVSAQTT
jgi:hypothetical protein